MGLKLYPHNKAAYDRAVAMLDETGKAAVIHPTGTGKSFIGFKLCEEHPEASVCWLSPSNYIIKTQRDNYLRETEDEGYDLRNVTFLTYAKLARQDAAETDSLRPDYIILDEFHRCGATVWGRGAEKLLAENPTAKVLGLTATAVRYLDNQRDMAEEIFDGNIASGMSLGEAIARGILKAPTYVLSTYRYTESLRQYEIRISGIRQKTQRDRATEYLERLKRALEKAEGLDVLFDRYMTDRRGKYIVFCPNYELMQEFMQKSGEWFHLVDEEPHIYSVYTADADTFHSLDRFAADSDSEHLRLLFCIDALNEGVHVEDISGVILLRPTVSPIIYKQQIGRALSAGCDRTPVIFDIVGNIENLYTIDALQSEVSEAVRYLQQNRGEAETVNEPFQILGELRSCIELFRELEDVITSSWDVMYHEAEKYFTEHGNLLVKQHYINDAGYPVGRWVHTQRQSRKNNDPALTDERISRLDSIGMEWQSIDEIAWERGYVHAREYFEAEGKPDIPAGYVASDGYPLGTWYRHVKDKYRTGRLSEENIRLLEEAGAVWEGSFERAWEEQYALAERYFREHGNLNIPVREGNLGIWISTQRSAYAKGCLTDIQIKRLETIGMSWNSFDNKWEQAYEMLLQYRDRHGDINSIPDGYRVGDTDLAAWLKSQRVRYRQGKLSPERREKLEAAGVIWSLQDAAWECGYSHAEAYFLKYGSLNMPQHYICEDGYRLKSWLNNQSTRFKNGKLCAAQREKLEALGMKFGVVGNKY